MEPVRHIAHFDQDTYFISVERLQNSALIGKPVIVGGGSDRGVVASCSYEARKFGVYSSMPMRLARQLCPDAIIVKGDYDKYVYYSRIITEIMTGMLPVVEKTSIDEHYVDMTGMDQYFGCFKYASEVREKVIKETGLPISFGMSINKVVSKVATGVAKPNGKLQIDSGGEKLFLAPMPVRKIPMIGEVNAKKLGEMGLAKVAQVQQIDIELMHRTFGKDGVSMWEKCNGIDLSPVVPYHEQKSMSTETTFEQDTTDMAFLRKTLIKMVTELSYDMRKEEKLTGCVTVKIKYADHAVYGKQARITYTASDRILTERVLDLFTKIYTRRQLLRLVGIKYSNLISGFYQADLFADSQEDLKLCRALDSIKNRFGLKAAMKAVEGDFKNGKYAPKRP